MFSSNKVVNEKIYYTTNRAMWSYEIILNPTNAINLSMWLLNYLYKTSQGMQELGIH